MSELGQALCNVFDTVMPPYSITIKVWDSDEPDWPEEYTVHVTTTTYSGKEEEWESAICHEPEDIAKALDEFVEEWEGE